MKTLLTTTVVLVLGTGAASAATVTSFDCTFDVAGVCAATVTGDEAGTLEIARRGRGADDAPGDDKGKGGKGADDPVGHT